MKKMVIVLAIVALSVGPAFGFTKGLTGGGNKQDAAAVTMDDAVASQSNLMKAYSQGVKYNLATQGTMAEALGLKEEAAKLHTAAESIQEGNAKGIEATKAETASLTEVVDQKMAAGGDLSDGAKKKVGQSLLTMAKSLLAYKTAADMSKSTLDLAQDVIKDAPMTQKISAKKTLDPVLTIAPKVPGELANVTTTAKQYIDFAKSVGVEPPADLNKALGDL